MSLTARASLAAAWAWIDSQPVAQHPQTVPLAQAADRVLVAPQASTADLPDADRAGTDGYAVRAAECDGASAYNPLLLTLQQTGPLLPAGAAAPIAAGWTMPTGADAVLRFEAAQPAGRMLEVLAAVPRGTGIVRRGGLAGAGAELLRRGRRITPPALAALALLGCREVAVLRAPRVRLLVPGPKHGTDALTPMLSALITRDGGQIEPLDRPDPGFTGEMLLIAGRSGVGPDDDAAAALQAAGGRLDLRGLAMRPGDTAALGKLGLRPVLLLPGDPFACLAAYDMLAGRLLRRLAGIDAALPYAEAKIPLARKIVSGVGVTDIVPVRIAGGRAQPVGEGAGLAAILQAGGFVVVGEGSEGFPAGAEVSVYLYPSGEAPP